MQNKKKSIQSAACNSLICPFSIIWVGLNNKALISSCVGSFNKFLYLCGYTLIIGHNKDHLMHANCSLHKGIRMQTVQLHLTKKRWTSCREINHPVLLQYLPNGGPLHPINYGHMRKIFLLNDLTANL